MDALTLPAVPTTSLLAGTDPAALAAQARPGDPKAAATAARGFESMFASLLIKQMRQTSGAEGMFGKDSGDVMGGMFDLYLGQFIAQAGGLGVGKIVEQQLTPARPTT